MNLSHIRSKAAFIDSLQPQARQTLSAQEPIPFSAEHVELMVADAVKAVAFAVADQQLAHRLLAYSREMAQQAVTALSTARESGSGSCPPWPWPWTARQPWIDTASAPAQAPIPSRAAEHLELARILTNLSGLTASSEHRQALQSFAVLLREKFEHTGPPEAAKAATLIP